MSQITHIICELCRMDDDCSLLFIATQYDVQLHYDMYGYVYLHEIHNIFHLESHLHFVHSVITVSFNVVYIALGDSREN